MRRSRDDDQQGRHPEQEERREADDHQRDLRAAWSTMAREGTASTVTPLVCLPGRSFTWV